MGSFRERKGEGNLGISERKGDGSLGIRVRKGMETWALERGMGDRSLGIN
jgi:hypothetical protein